MANRFLRSADGVDADSGATWALAKATLAGIAAIDTVGDTIFVSKTHAESSATAPSWTLGGTRTAPQRIVCVDDTGDPPSPTTLSVGAKFTITGTASSVSFTIANAAYWYGIEWDNSATGASSSIAIAPPAATCQVFEKCIFGLNGGGATASINASSGTVRWIDCNVKFSHAGQNIQPGSNGFSFFWIGGAYVAGSAHPTALVFLASTRPMLVQIENVDLGAFPNAIFDGSASSGRRCVVRNCKLNATTTLVTSAPPTGSRYVMENCDSGATNYRLWVEDGPGSIRDETVIVRSGGASDGATPISHKMTTNANATEFEPLMSEDIMIWNSAIGSAKTATLEIVNDGVTLTNAEIWGEVLFPGSAASPLGSRANDKMASTLATPAAQASSSATWTTTGLTTPIKQKIDVTFTPQAVGWVILRVYLARPSKTVYIDPKPTLA